MTATARQLHVVDEALRQTPKKHWDWRSTEKLLPQARRYIFSDDASTRLGEIIRDAEDMILANHQFAIPPYPVTYVEINSELMLRATGKPSSLDFYPNPDVRVGYLITKDRVRAFSMDGRGWAGPTGLNLRHGPGVGFSSMPLPAKLGDERWGRLVVLLGTGVHSLPSQQVKSEILRDWALEPVFPADNFGMYSGDRAADIVLSGAGELRNLLAALLVLNQPKVIEVTSVGRANGIYRGKRRVYASHSVVNINMGQRKSYRRLFTGGTHASPVGHEVEGHFVHYHLVKGCEHVWPLLPTKSEYSDAPVWLCQKCGGRRVWKENFVRGDTSRGFKTKDYEVTYEPQST